MDKDKIKAQFKEIKKNALKLDYSSESIVELGSLKIQAVRIANEIKDKHYKLFCLTQIKELSEDEFAIMFSTPNSKAFFSALNEFLAVIDDCVRGEV
ncbi:hypothetical protein [Lacibacter sp.]|uniref:hypothetical protein n=1 Tax=Lacibacter sp. TaxID=1915409 RepID=UPI002B4AE819|nr:hypothetical protein [Lacibacter sp.]HLP35331.1 hypothetical protein [Lacibacter sp.]